MDIRLFIRAISRFILGIVIVGGSLFVSANTLNYWNAWLFMGILFIPMFIVGIVMLIKAPELLEKRLNMREKKQEQMYVVIFSGIMFFIGFILAGFNYRFSWISISNVVVVVSSIIFILAYIMYAMVLNENKYLSRTVEIQDKQEVVDTGLYSIIRHPMYASTVMLFLSMPLILGSLISFCVFLVYPFIIAIRIKMEEKILEKELQGYKEYKDRVKYKMIPFIW